MHERWYKLAAGSASMAALLGLWEWSSTAGHVNPVLLPPPSTVFPVLWELLATGAFVEPLASTMALLFTGFAVGTLLAVILGLLMGSIPAIYNLFEPLTEAIRPIPKPALVPPLFLFFGAGSTTMIIIIAAGVFFPVLINTVQGVRGVDQVLLDTARTFRLSRARTLLTIVFPAAMPLILTGMRISLGIGLVIVIVAEMLASENGIGLRILDLERSFEIAEMYAWIILLSVVGLVLSVGFEKLEYGAVPWRSK